MNALPHRQLAKTTSKTTIEKNTAETKYRNNENE